jgi:hypothetical protein
MAISISAAVPVTAAVALTFSVAGAIALLVALPGVLVERSGRRHLGSGRRRGRETLGVLRAKLLTAAVIAAR